MNNQVFYFLLLVLVISGCSSLNAQEKKPEPGLYSEIFHIDSVLFNAFNKRDIESFQKLFTSDLEFYHDKGGLTGYTETIGFMKSTAVDSNGLTRDLVPGTLEVYPVPNYGAMEIGSHTFCQQQNGKQDCGTFKFVHIWKKIGSEWNITRV
jgi:hypothetical protein